MESSTPRGMIEAYVPFSLMPVAAVLGLYLLAALVRIGYLIYANTVNDTETLPKRTTARERLLLQQKQQKYASQNAAAAVGWDGGVVPLQSREFGLLFLSLVLVTIAYAFTVARVEGGFQRAAYKAFNPYALLSLSPPAHPDDPPIPAAVIQDAFKAAIQLLKASNADEAQMENVKLAYQALQDERGMRNYQRFGHPNGPLEVPAFCLRIPIWLLYPSGPWSAVVYLLYVGAVLLLLYLTVGWYRDRQEREKSNQRTTQEKDEAAAALLDATNSVAQGDLDFIGNTLNPTSDHMDILYAVCAAPETLQWALKDLDRIQQLKEDRLRQDNKASETDNNKSKKKDDLDLGALLDDGDGTRMKIMGIVRETIKGNRAILVLHLLAQRNKYSKEWTRMFLDKNGLNALFKKLTNGHRKCLSFSNQLSLTGSSFRIHLIIRDSVVYFA